MNKKLHSEAVDQLFEAILCLKNKEECYTFFEDVCTINELLSLSQRFEVAAHCDRLCGAAGENAAGEENVSGNLRKDGSIHGDDQPREPFLKLWKRRI